MEELERPYDKWELPIVDSCSGRPVRVDTIVLGPGPTDISIVGSRRVRSNVTSGQSATATARNALKRPGRYYDQPTEITPAGGTQPRWLCPMGRCQFDVNPRWSTLLKVAQALQSDGVSVIELSALAARLSKQ